VTPQNVERIKLLVGRYFESNLSVDLEDEDHVMRIETENEIHENEIIQLTKKNGFLCEMLTD
jgi:hypothetical protein